MKTPKILSRDSLKFITLLVLSNISLNSFTATAQSDPKLINAYKDALIDSVTTETDEITDNLTIIDSPQANPNLYWDKQGRVLVVTFAETPNFNLSNEIWVTVAPKLKFFCTTYKSQNPNIQTAQLNQRIEQKLGIIPESGKTYIVELWVDPTHLKRPTIQADTKNVEISNPDSLNLSDSQENTFLQWLYNEQLKNRKALQDKLNLPASQLVKSEYPWTGLGYTFDWASKLDPCIKEFGLSEFVIWGTQNQTHSSGSAPLVEVSRVFTTEQYCKPDNSL